MKLMGDSGGLAEFYGTKRFMTVTGEQMHGAPRE